VGRTREVIWIDIEDPDPADADQYPLVVFAEAFRMGGALFSRLEGCWYGDGSIYFNATDGGNASAGQIWRYTPRETGGGELTLLFESPSHEVLSSPDNITVSPRGGLLICEDSVAPFIRGLTQEGKIFDFARNIFNGREFAGVCFSPDGRTLFVNIQGDTSVGGPGNLGMTFAIWGPWERGVL
jgi:secreted PhoX family phosphatase